MKQKFAGARGALILLVIIAVGSFAMPAFKVKPAANGYQIQLVVPAPLLTNEAVNTVSAKGLAVNETFVKAAVEGYACEGLPGDPALPAGSFNLAYEGADPAVTVDNVETETIALGGKLYPVQPPLFYDDPYAGNGFAYNPESYAKTFGKKAAPAYASVTGLFTYRGQKVAAITVQPARYDPSANTLTMVKQMTLTVSLTKPSLVRSLHSKAFDQIMRAMFVNLDGVPAEPFYKEKYLIIATPTYRNCTELANFVTYRSGQYDIKLVSTADVGGTTKEAYRTYIRQEMPTFCLLVGAQTGTVFPSWNTTSWNSMNFYVATQVTNQNAKPMPDISLGLFYVTSATQIANAVNKIMLTERSLATMPKVVHGQGGNNAQMGSLPPDHCDKTIIEVLDKYFPASTGFQTFKYATTTSGGNTRAVTQFNKGCYFNIYNGHGYTGGQVYGWGTTDLTSMKNTVYPFVLSCACLTGTWDQSCVAAAAIGNQYGPVAYIGSHSNSSMGQHVLNQGYAEAIMRKNITRNGLAFIYGVNYDSTPKEISQYMGEVTTSLKAMMGWQYHYYGDPSIETMDNGPRICITAPKAGDQWESGLQQQITWTDNITANVKIELLKGGVLQSTLTASTPSNGAFDWIIGLDIPGGNDYKIRITSIADTGVWDTSGTFTIVPEYIIIPPYFQPFDTLDTNSTVMPYKFDQSTADSLDWLVWKGPTPSRNGSTPNQTGAQSDHTSGQGNYLYIEASSPNNPAKTAEFTTPKFRLRGTNLSLSYWLHMFSSPGAMGSLVLDICVDGTWHNAVQTVSGNQGDQWIQKTLDLAPYAGDRVVFRFRGTTGTSFASDICMDDLRINGIVSALPRSIRVASGYTVALAGDRLHFTMPDRVSPFTVTLYNAQGRTVARVVHGAAETGNFSMPVTALPSGLYIVKMETKEFVRSTNVLIAR